MVENEEEVEKAVKIYAELRKKGMLIEDDDIFIEVISICHDSILITNNEKHFKIIVGLKAETLKRHYEGLAEHWV